MRINHKNTIYTLLHKTKKPKYKNTLNGMFVNYSSTFLQNG